MIFVVFISALFLIYLVIDYIGPRIIRIRPGKRFGFNTFEASDLIVQEFDEYGHLWASRGYLIYRRKKGDNRFVRIGRVPHGKWIYWLNNFTLIRRITGKPECMEVSLTAENQVCALSGGIMWFGNPALGTCSPSLKLSHYGPGIGRGILSNGLLLSSKGKLFFGEYFNNPDRSPVRIYRSDDHGASWEVAREFLAGEIRHIHVIQEDPFTGSIWCCSGDHDHECRIEWTTDDFTTLQLAGAGSQQWRTCHLVFTDEAVYWGTDTGSADHSGIFRWDRQSGNVTRQFKVEGAVFFGTRLKSGLLAMTTDREGFPNENDDRTKLICFRENGLVQITDFGTWKTRKGPGAAFALLRMPRKQGSDYLALSVLNQAEISECRLVMFDEEELEPDSN